MPSWLISPTMSSTVGLCSEELLVGESKREPGIVPPLCKAKWASYNNVLEEAYEEGIIQTGKL